MRGRHDVSLLLVALIGAAVGCASATSDAGPEPAPFSVTGDPVIRPVPATAPWGREVLSVRAKGVQTYRVERPVGGKPRLTFVGPRASLVDDQGRAVGTHFMGETGPVWEIGGGRVTGRKLRERPSASPGSIPELQLAATVSGNDVPLAGVTFVERLDTMGGAAPAPDDSMREGDLVDVPYEARYVFYAAAP